MAADLSSLYIFSKNTDANASIKGYNFQTLKTVETWLVSYLNKAEGKIFCEFEEDIFEYGKEVLKFRQLKLYSSNFSFSTEEVQKAIFHFFMLHVKTDYRNIEKEFIFEANSSIAGKYKDNDVELLSHWNENQGKLSGELLAKCINKAREIIGEGIAELANPSPEGEVKPEIKVAQEVLASLDDEDWDAFVQCIRWKFANTEPELEFTKTIQSINDLIGKLPYPSIDESALIGILYKYVSLKASEKLPQDRALTREGFDQLLLSSGSDSDRWYIEVFEKWRNTEKITDFHIGDFYEILNAAKHCRSNPYLIDHTETWINVLSFFIFGLEIRRSLKLEAMYEYLWLNIRPMEMYKLPVGTLEGVEDIIRDYLSNFQDFYSTNDLENAQSILNITSTAVLMNKANVSIQELAVWYKRLFRAIGARLRMSKNPNEICHLLEEFGSLKMFLIDYRIKEMSPEYYLLHFEEILKYVNTAPLYHLTTLGKRINAYINIYIKNGSEQRKQHISALEAFSEKLDSYIHKRNGDIEFAKGQVERGVAYLQSGKKEYFLKALTCFHTAKNFYFANETMEGFVLALFNISQVYSAIGMHFAAKYYALAAGWICVHDGDIKLLTRIETSYRLMFYADYFSGSWFSAIMDIERSFDATDEFTPTSTPFLLDEPIAKVLSYLAVIFYTGKKLSPQFIYFIEYHLERTGMNFIKDSIQMLEAELDTDEKLITFLEQRIDDVPFNDCGKRRHIRFYAMGTCWTIEFENNYHFTPLAEEFCSVLQIVLAEIALSDIDFHFLKGTIKVNLLEGEHGDPVQIANNKEFEWDVNLTVIENIDVTEVKIHFAKNTACIVSILDKISLLPSTEFIRRLTEFVGSQNLASKVSILNAYQKMYCLLFKSEDYGKLQVGAFQPIEHRFKLPCENRFMQWRSDLSAKYDAGEAFEAVEGRFKNVYKCIHRTIEKLKYDEEFKTIVRELRQKGYVDWEIALAIMNFIANQKVTILLGTRVISNQNEYVSAMAEEMRKIVRMDEDEFYVEFTTEAFKSFGFDFQIKQLPLIVLKTYGFENKAHFPNFETIREFLSVRFKLYENNEWKNNFLKDIV